ncbi:unnamed protein product [Trifolium pratense]|uniref:Uncharacterized protein n=1 Tax=Trifolium pratense TaxID=57577 RepID=A0ACB0KAG1_TRIPR|nr:unnamed protein product [Trifolium pratense]
MINQLLSSSHNFVKLYDALSARNNQLKLDHNPIAYNQVHMVQTKNNENPLEIQSKNLAKHSERGNYMDEKN